MQGYAKPQDATQREHKMHGTKSPGRGAVSVRVSDKTVREMQEIALRISDRWYLCFDRPELLRLTTQVAIQVIEHNLVVCAGSDPAVDVAPSDGVLQPHYSNIAKTGTGRTCDQAVWIDGLTKSGLQWVQGHLERTGCRATRSDALELAVELTLQALGAGLVLQPKGPQVTVVLPQPAGLVRSNNIGVTSHRPLVALISPRANSCGREVGAATILIDGAIPCGRQPRHTFPVAGITARRGKR